MSATFGGATFGERPAGQLFPRFGRKAEYSLVHIPGSSTTIIQSAGRTADELNLEGLFTGAELTAMLAKVDTVASLVYSGGTRSAYLAEIVPSQIGVKDAYFVQLKFIGR